MSITSSDSIDLLEKRIQKLESKIGTDADVSNLPNSKVTEMVGNLNARINIALSGRERIQALIKRIPEMNELLDACMHDELAIDDLVKMNIILAEEECVRDITAQLERIEDMKSVLDSEHIKSVPTFSDKLMELKRIQISQKQEADSISSEVRDLLESYNNMLLSASQLFSKWDDIVTKAEIAAIPKKSLQ